MNLLVWKKQTNSHSKSPLRVSMGDAPWVPGLLSDLGSRSDCNNLPAPCQERMPPMPSVLSVSPSAAWKWCFLEGLSSNSSCSGFSNSSWPVRVQKDHFFPNRFCLGKNVYLVGLFWDEPPWSVPFILSPHSRADSIWEAWMLIKGRAVVGLGRCTEWFQYRSRWKAWDGHEAVERRFPRSQPSLSPAVCSQRSHTHRLPFLPLLEMITSPKYFSVGPFRSQGRQRIQTGYENYRASVSFGLPRWRSR